jgi:NlpC/P60 family/Bacterial dipeptidyl-peptidase Sh3 domain
MIPDPRLNAYRADLADERLRDRVVARRYVAGQSAWVIAPRTAVWADRTRAEVVSYFHYGEELRVFETEEGVAWCQPLFDGYVGYVDRFDIEPGPAPTPTHYVATMGAYTYLEPDLRSTMLGCLPRHSAVAVVQTGLVTRGTEYARIDIAGHVPLTCLSRQPPRSRDLAVAAALYIGCPYLWGGRSFFGIDCSGLVQSAFRDLAVTVPRDTDMQRDAIGELVSPTSLADLRRGDLLYLPGHVLIYEGDGTVIHADGAGMTVRRDNLREWIGERGLGFAAFAVRRP